MSNNDWQQGPSDPQRPPQQQQYQQPQQPDPFQDRPYDQPPVHQPRTSAPMDSNDIIAVILSWFFPGVGQIMLGQKTKGIVVLLVSILTCYGGGLLAIASVIDAYCLAKARKYRAIDDWEFFPDIKSAF